MAISYLDVKPSQVVYIGDHIYDILAGKKAGVKTIGVYKGIVQKNTFLKEGAHIVVSSLKELLVK
jgi:pyrophosphatase PpaX